LDPPPDIPVPKPLEIPIGGTRGSDTFEQPELQDPIEPPGVVVILARQLLFESVRH
jgi:hypothetical protein